MFSTQLLIDADMSEDGWEISVRFDAESQQAGWSDLDDDVLPTIVGDEIAAILISERDAVR